MHSKNNVRPVHPAAHDRHQASPLQTGRGRGVEGGGRVIAKARLPHEYVFIAGRARGGLPVRGVIEARRRRRRGGYGCASNHMLLATTAV